MNAVRQWRRTHARQPGDSWARPPVALSTVRGGARRRMAPSTSHGGVTRDAWVPCVPGNGKSAA